MRKDQSEITRSSVIRTPEAGWEKFEAEVMWHMIEAERILREKHNVWNVRLEAEVQTDRYGNRFAHFHPLRQTKISPTQYGPWERVEMDSYVADGAYAAFNGGHRTYEPARTASSIELHLRAYTKEAKEQKA